jgi:hypothetical protein
MKKSRLFTGSLYSGDISIEIPVSLTSDIDSAGIGAGEDEYR